MIAVDVIRNAAAAGITLAARGNQLSVVPAAKLSPDLRLLLVAHKVELLAYLRQPANDPPATTYGTGCDSRGRPLQPLVTCGACTNFRPNSDNPEVGCGTCALGEPDLGGWPYFPGARRCCASYQKHA